LLASCSGTMLAPRADRGPTFSLPAGPPRYIGRSPENALGQKADVRGSIKKARWPERREPSNHLWAGSNDSIARSANEVKYAGDLAQIACGYSFRTGSPARTMPPCTT